MTQVSIMVNHPAQYFAPAFRELANASNVGSEINYWLTNQSGSFEPGFNRHVTWKEDLYGGYNWWAPDENKGNFRRALDCLFHLKRRRPEVLICFGWASPIARIGLLYGLVSGTPVLLYGDTNGRVVGRGWRAQLRRLTMTGLTRCVAGALTTGVANRRFYRLHGMPESSLFPGVMPISLNSFLRAGDGRKRTLEGGVSPRPVIGFAGKLQPHKGPADLIQALALVSEATYAELRIIGDGPLRAELEEMSRGLGLAGKVRFLGFQNSDEIPDELAATDIFVMPSRYEPRGLVAIEAMATGSVPIVSSATGVWGDEDALQDGVTGLVFPVGSIDSLAGCISKLADDPDLLFRMSAAARERSQAFGPADFARSVAHAVSAVRKRPTKATIARSIRPHRMPSESGDAVDDGGAPT